MLIEPYFKENRSFKCDFDFVFPPVGDEISATVISYYNIISIIIIIIIIIGRSISSAAVGDKRAVLLVRKTCYSLYP